MRILRLALCDPSRAMRSLRMTGLSVGKNESGGSGTRCKPKAAAAWLLLGDDGGHAAAVAEIGQVNARESGAG